VDAEEPGVEPQAEGDLRDRREEEEERQGAVVGRGKIRRVERDEEEADEVREDVGGAVDGGVGGELAQVGERRSRRQSRPLSEVK
jgi:hypothetical protein